MRGRKSTNTLVQVEHVRNFAHVHVDRLALRMEGLEKGCFVFLGKSLSVLMSCSCRKRCASLFDAEELVAIIESIHKLSPVRKREMIVDLLFASYSGTRVSCEIKRRRISGEEPQRSRVEYCISGRRTCQVFFASCFDVSIRTLDNYISHLGKISPCVPVMVEKRGGSRTRQLGMASKTKKAVVTRHIMKFASEHGYLSPSGRSAHADEKELVVAHLPSDIKTKDDLFNIIKKRTLLSVSYSYFLRVWKSCVPNVKFLPSGTDYCNECARLLRDRPGGFEAELKAHREAAFVERRYYKECLIEADEAFKRDGSCLHISFDYAQAVRLPHEKLQAQAEYYSSGLKVDMFGIVCETTKDHWVYLTNEGEHPGKCCKGSMHVLSFLDNYISHLPDSVSHLLVHADNCVSQNKNKFLLSYFHLLVLCGRFNTIRFMFMLPGHTKFSVDGIFGVIKRRYFREVGVFTADDFEQVVLHSSDLIHVKRLCEDDWIDWREVFANLVSVISSKHVKMFQIFEFIGDGENVKMHVYASSSDFKKEHGIPWILWPTYLTRDTVEQRLVQLKEQCKKTHTLLSAKRVKQLTKIKDSLISTEKKGWWETYIQEHGMNNNPRAGKSSRRHNCMPSDKGEPEGVEHDADDGNEIEEDEMEEEQSDTDSASEEEEACSGVCKRYVDAENERLAKEMDPKWLTKCVELTFETLGESAMLTCAFCGESPDASASAGDEEEPHSRSWWQCVACGKSYCEICSDHELNDETGLCSLCGNPEMLFLQSISRT
jgi:hypothetical protein